MLFTVAVVVVVVASAGVVVWRLNARGGGSEQPLATGAPTPPSGDQRPPANDLLPSLEREPTDPQWTYFGDAHTRLLGGDSNTVVVSGERGILALDAATGTPHWPNPVLPQPAVPASALQDGHCVLDRTATTIGCTFGTGDDVPIAFFDAATGAQRSSTTGPYDLERAGDGFVTSRNGTVTGYRSDGAFAWKNDPSKLPYPTATDAKIFIDQGLVMINSGGATYDVLNVNTGEPILHSEGTGLRDGLGFAAGFAVSNRKTIDFYDFTGKKMASAPAQGFHLDFQIRTLTDGYLSWNVSRGVYHPVAYNERTGEMRAFDGATGHVIWTEKTVQNPKEMDAQVAGMGDLCFIYTDANRHNASMKIQNCGTQSDSPLQELPTEGLYGFRGSDGQRILTTGEHNALVCVDTTTGREVWRKADIQSPEHAGAGLYSTAYSSGSHNLIRWF